MGVGGAVEDYSILVKLLRSNLHNEGNNSDTLPILVQGALLSSHATAPDDSWKAAK